MFVAIVVIVILLVTIAAAVLIYTPTDDDNGDDTLGSTVTAKEMCEDWSQYRGVFHSWDDGDKVTIRDEISDIDYVPGSSSYGKVNWTIITFDSTSMDVDNFYEADIPEDELWGMMIFKGDLTDEYGIGDEVEVEVIIVDYDYEGDVYEIPDWYVGIMDVYQDKIDFSEINFPGASRISHAD